MKKFPPELIGFAVFVLFVFAAAIITYKTMTAYDNISWKVTCPQGVYSGEVIHKTFIGWVDVATGNKVIVPDNCAWQEVK